jgi:ribosomal protein S18 acetylase RimI-like enzyme
MTLVSFEPKDASSIITWFTSKTESLAWGGRVFGWPLSTQAVVERSLYDTVAFYVLKHGAIIIGFIEIQTLSQFEKRLCRVAIAPSAQRRGNGRNLIQLAINLIKTDKNITTISLAVFKSNQSAFNCYQSVGFKVVDREPAFKVFDGAQWPLYQMEYSLI